MAWLRLYDDIIDKPKVMMLEPPVFKTWVLCLCVSKATEGVLPSLKQVAFQLRISESMLDNHIAQLVKNRLIDEIDGGYKMHGWDKRQFTSDTSTERVNRYRKARYDAGLSSAGYQKYRPEVLARDGHACRYCGAVKNLVLDHLIPVVKGGDDSIDNLITACKACNSRKAGRSIQEAGMSLLSLPVSRPVTVTETGTSVTEVSRVTSVTSVTPRDRVDTETETESEQKRLNLYSYPQSTPVEDWVAKLRDKHPKPSDERFVATFCSDNWYRLSEDERRYTEFMGGVWDGLCAWCDYWNANGLQFATDLAKWLHGSGWKKPVPQPQIARRPETRFALPPKEAM